MSGVYIPSSVRSESSDSPERSSTISSFCFFLILSGELSPPPRLDVDSRRMVSLDSDRFSLTVVNLSYFLRLSMVLTCFSFISLNSINLFSTSICFSFSYCYRTWNSPSSVSSSLFVVFNYFFKSVSVASFSLRRARI